MELNYTEIGIKIKQRRKQLGMTQKDLAIKVDLSEGSVSRYEHGKVEDATIAKLTEFATVLCVDLTWLIGFKEQTEFETRLKSILTKAQSVPNDVLFKLLDSFENDIDLYIDIYESKVD